ncbi:MAG: pyridoxamine 5'-phosphate oxidase [Phycisphaeraceae bacterium]|jgi:pyridoxamine 5'-phosphate oxidase|nr:pyridoxamine 5'-phosphate oxidase [Phycisphaeraceae bacterium]
MNDTMHDMNRRREYGRIALNEADVDRDPLVQFDCWFADAQGTDIKDPNAMTLATASADGVPSARIVLLRGADVRGFAFYTNYDSRKAKELADNAHVSLVFHWPPLSRQVRIDGAVATMPPEESQAYFATRPRSSQISAWASAQSDVITDRAALDLAFKEISGNFSGRDVPCPPNWGGYRVVPHTIEFWQGRDDRLHDRIRYRMGDSGAWIIERLAP